MRQKRQGHPLLTSKNGHLIISDNNNIVVFDAFMQSYALAFQNSFFYFVRKNKGTHMHKKKREHINPASQTLNSDVGFYGQHRLLLRLYRVKKLK
jgi:hypothetical protein